MRQAKNISIMHKIQLKWTKKSFNKVAKQQIFIKKNIRLKAPIPADKDYERRSEFSVRKQRT